jgi:general secretion pathway protein J
MTTYFRIKGFTLVELIVVLVIVGLSSALLAQGLETTWRNFSKLNVNQLSADRSKLPLKWFTDSVKAILLSHPNKVVFSGTNTVNEFTSFLAPDQSTAIKKPIALRWSVSQVEEYWELQYTNLYTNVSYTIFKFDQPISFKYFINGQWESEYREKPGLVPEVIAIFDGSELIVTATVGRPSKADIPAELPAFGKYEFGT